MISEIEQHRREIDALCREYGVERLALRILNTYPVASLLEGAFLGKPAAVFVAVGMIVETVTS